MNRHTIQLRWCEVGLCASRRNLRRVRHPGFRCASRRRLVAEVGDMEVACGLPHLPLPVPVVAGRGRWVEVASGLPGGGEVGLSGSVAYRCRSLLRSLAPPPLRSQLQQLTQEARWFARGPSTPTSGYGSRSRAAGRIRGEGPLLGPLRRTPEWSWHLPHANIGGRWESRAAHERRLLPRE